jgi:hypothetical protein
MLVELDHRFMELYRIDFQFFLNGSYSPSSG